MSERRIVRIILDETSIIRRSPEVEQERAVAIYDILESITSRRKAIWRDRFTCTFESWTTAG